MPPMTALTALGWAVFSGAFALLTAFALGGEIRADAARVSHQAPVGESWFLETTASSPALVADGRKLYLNNCAHCHAADATGDEGPDLHDLEVSDRYIQNTISRGIPHEMPSFGKKLAAPELQRLTAYLRSLHA